MPGPICYGLGGSAPTITDAVQARFERAWTEELSRYTDELARRHSILEREARELGGRLGTLPAQVIDLDIAPPQPDPGSHFVALIQPCCASAKAMS